MKLSLLICISPGSLPKNGTLLNIIIKIPAIIRKTPIKMSGDSIFITLPLRLVLLHLRCPYNAHGPSYMVEQFLKLAL